MNQNWKTLLQSLDATFDPDNVAQFRQQSADSADLPCLVETSALAVIDVEGEDAASFMQSQSCNDQNLVSDEQAQFTGYCNPKGRLLALYVVMKTHTGYRLLLSEDLVEGFIKRWQMFIMRAKVSLTHRQDLVCSGLVADQSGDIGDARQHLPDMPVVVLGSTSFASSAETQWNVVRWHDSSHGAAAAPRKRYLCISDVDSMAAFWKRTAPSVCLESFDFWRLGDIAAGVPHIASETREAFVPQMVNLQQIDGLSFKKGCYPGQEIVARMQYLGKLKRCMKRFKVEGTDLPVAGEALSTATDAAAGQVVDAVMGPDGLEVLAVVKITVSAEELELRGQRLQLLELPYELPSPDIAASCDALNPY